MDAEASSGTFNCDFPICGNLILKSSLGCMKQQARNDGEGFEARLRQMLWRGLCPAAEVGHSASMSPAPRGSDLLKVMYLVSL